jgi:hypothetical protein
MFKSRSKKRKEVKKYSEFVGEDSSRKFAATCGCRVIKLEELSK